MTKKLLEVVATGTSREGSFGAFDAIAKYERV
jgi:hypothetical protein